MIVIGTSTKLEKISSGGINLIDCMYSPEMLSELSKMDGAIIVSDDVTKILKANVHLNPSDTLLTSQTGTRHRTAERTAEETNLTVLTVSEESSLVKVFTNAGTTELEEPSVTLGRVNESLQSVDRMRRRFDDAVAELGELEIENSLTNQEVLEVIQRGELLTRLANQVRTEALKLGGEAGLILIQIDSFESGVKKTFNLVLKDHLPSKKYRNITKAVEAISQAMGGKVHSFDIVRGPVDFVAVVEADSFTNVAAIKLAVEASGSISNMTICEAIDIKSAAEMAGKVASVYKPAG